MRRAALVLAACLGLLALALPACDGWASPLDAPPAPARSSFDSQEERDAWDAYASACLTNGGATAFCVDVANAMIARRREQMGPR